MKIAFIETRENYSNNASKFGKTKTKKQAFTFQQINHLCQKMINVYWRFSKLHCMILINYNNKKVYH